MRRILATCLLAAGFPLPAACSNATPAAGASADPSASATALQHDHTTEAGDSVALPEGWPADFPLYDGRVVSETVDGNTLAAYVTVASRDEANKALDLLKQSGYTQQSLHEMGGDGFVAIFDGPYAATVTYQDAAATGPVVGYIITLS